MKAKSWEVTDAFWSRVEPLIPPRAARDPDRVYVRQPGGGRKPKAARLVFEGIVFVLRRGCQWKALPAERFGSASAIHQRFLAWEQAGFFESLWRAGLTEYADLAGIAWRWQRDDESPDGAEASRSEPHRSGKKRGASGICWSMGAGFLYRSL